MKKASLIYSLVGLLATGTFTGLLFINRTQAQSHHNHHHTDSAADQQHCQMGKLNQQQKEQHYIEMMVFHHQEAIKMADLALNQAKRPEIKQLAQEIKKAQTEEMEQMKNWYKQWYGAEVPTHSHQATSDHSEHCEMMSMMSSNVEDLKNSSDFDKVFIEKMIPHHQHGVMMSEMVVNSDRPELSNLAKTIIQTEKTEIEQLQQWLDTWY